MPKNAGKQCFFCVRAEKTIGQPLIFLRTYAII